MPDDTVAVCDHLSDFTVIGVNMQTSACWCHLADAVAVAQHAWVSWSEDAVRICGANRTFPARHSHETE